MVLMALSMSASLQPNCRRFPAPKGRECALRGHPKPTNAPVQRGVIFSRFPNESAQLGSGLQRPSSNYRGYLHAPVNALCGLAIGLVCRP